MGAMLVVDLVQGVTQVAFVPYQAAVEQLAAALLHPPFHSMTAFIRGIRIPVSTVRMPASARRHLGVGLISYGPLHAGVLAGALQALSEGRASDEAARQRIETYRDRLEAYEGLCRELGAEQAAWLLRNPVLSTTVVGAMTIEELRSDLDALSVQLNDEVVQRLDRIWPGPGEAPQAYTW